MSFWQRIKTIGKSRANAVADKLEDPELILNQLILDMREQITSANKQVAVAVADEKRLQKRFQDQASAAAEWERKAMLAVNAGRDDLAVEALNRQKQAHELAVEYEKQFQLQKAATDKLRESLRALNEKVEEAKRKKDLLIARKRRAEAQQQIHDTISGMSTNSAFDTFDRMAEKVDRIEAEAEASVELANDIQGMDLNEKFKDLERTSGASDALAALKARMAGGEAQSTTAAPTAATESADDFNFEELEAELAAARTNDKGNSNNQF